jgi:hypothetical protein
MSIVNAIVGIVLLLLGRRLFWFFVAASGFAAGMFVAHEHLKLQSDALVLAIALLSGVIGALLAFFLQKLAVSVAGFLAGGFVGMTLASLSNSDAMMWAGFAVCGILGALLLLVVFEWTLIILSSLLGAALVSDSVLGAQAPALVFVVSLCVGICVQALQREKRRVESQIREQRPS